MLHFTDTNDFKEALKIAEYRCDSLLDIWEATKGYESLRHKFNNQSFNSADAYSESIQNISFDNALMSLINKQTAVRIGDTVYLSFFKKGEVVFINTENSAYAAFNLRRSNGDCSSRRVIANKYYDADYEPTSSGNIKYILVGTKYNEISFFSAKVGCGISILSNDGAGNYYLGDGKFHMRKDPWHSVCYKKQSQSNYTCITIDVLMKNTIVAVKYFNYNFKKVIGFLPEELCVSEFGRVHYWLWDYYKDLHIDGWN